MKLELRSERRSGWATSLRLLGVTLVAVVILVTLAAAAGVALLRHAMWKQLPVLDGTLKLPGLRAPVTVRRDEHGVPHIEAANMDDLLLAQGYVVAQDRLWQMDMARRLSAGELAEVLGSGVVEHDRLQRVLQIRPTAERLTASMSAEQRRLFEDFARGVNAYIASHQNNLPAEYSVLRYQPRAWQPIDSWLVALNMVQRLDTQYPDKLDREAVEAKLGPTLGEQLYPTTTWRDHPPTQALPDLTAPQQNVPQTPLDESQSRLENPRTLEDLLHLREVINLGEDICDTCKPGSNEWVVSGAHTASGKPLLSNDMHLEHGIPDIWHEEDLRAGDFHVAGVTVPGIPFIIAGHNAHIAWGFTTLNGDVQDVYVEKTNSAGEYWSGNGWRQPEHDPEHIHVRGGSDVNLDVLVTEHGPVITPMLPNERRMLSLKWSIYDAANVGLPIEAIDAATNWEEFRKATSQWWAPTQNVVYADDQGHIGYQAVGRFPLRPAGLSGVPIVEQGTADDLRHEWQGWLPFEQLPTVLDPVNGVLVTANSRITPDSYPTPLTLEWFDPYRNERIWKMLAGRNNLTRADMLALQMDVYSDVDHGLAQRFAYAIDHAPKSDARLRKAADMMRNWNGVVRAESPEAEIVDATKRALWPMILEPRMGADWRLYTWKTKDFVQEEMVEHSAPQWLPQGYQSWDDLITAAVKQGMKDGHAPLDLADWSYGSQHLLSITHPLYRMLPLFARGTSVGPLPVAGDGTTVNQVRGLLGPSQRFTMDWSDVDHSTENIVMGESGDPVSPYYRDQWPFWYAVKTFELPFTQGAVNAAAKHTLRLVP